MRPQIDSEPHPTVAPAATKPIRHTSLFPKLIDELVALREEVDQRDALEDSVETPRPPMG